MNADDNRDLIVRDNNTLSGDVSITGADDQVIDGEFC